MNPDKRFNMSAFEQGLTAKLNDEETGELTANPYTYDSREQQDWYEGYRYEDEIEKTKFVK